MRYAELFRHFEGISENEFVLHGSPHRLATLEPRQTTYVSKKHFERHGLYATPCVEIALLYALIHEERSEWGWALGGSEQEPKIFVHVFNGFTPNSGYVYVAERKLFKDIKRGNGLVQVTHKIVTPVEILEVDASVFEELQEKSAIEIVLCDPPSS